VRFLAPVPAGDPPPVVYPRWSPSDLWRLEVRIGGVPIKVVRDPESYGPVFFHGRAYPENTQLGFWQMLMDHPLQPSDKHGVLKQLAFGIGPFPSEAECREYDLEDDAHLEDVRYQSLQVHFWTADLDAHAIGGLIENFESRRQQARHRRSGSFGSFSLNYKKTTAAIFK
jgi:hypothetical protein